ncbi:SEL1-like repeat protein [Massilia sp. RP-1-19]|uniref:SEL1-like repeat protein n=1 Tax=Massilia polaris TaxID=2728846 RepID=A0A848HJ86_9BURK|nr:SEL1-like repeat protein [Massilia polaris]NML60250.1 SEL1-like repeat protein [Massilia polaris]
MANREELAIIRGARGGNAAAQLELGKRYLFGSTGLPRSLPTALHWLERAAQQECREACELIGAHIPIELASLSLRPLAPWYERAHDAGGLRAGIVYAQLVLADAGVEQAVRVKALRALEAAADGGFGEAAQLLSHHRRARTGAAAPPSPAPAAPKPLAIPAAASSIPLIDAAWQARDWHAWLAVALPLARALVAASAEPGRLRARLDPGDVLLLSRCAQLLDAGALEHAAGADELRRFWELAAAENDREAQLAMGLGWARMRLDGQRTTPGSGSANFREAIRWLALAGEQGLAEAWYALSRIYIKPEFSQRNVSVAQRYLERAAGMGYREAQLECGNNAWRARRENESNDVRAVYWLQKAAAQGCTEARAALDRIAPREPGRLPGRQALSGSHPLLAARLELAGLFGLSRAEALLLDVARADCGHCMVIDIRSSYRRSKRRLVMVETAREREALDRIVKVFDGIDGGPGGPEGNYRQRLYRLKTAAPDACLDSEVARFEMAA